MSLHSRSEHSRGSHKSHASQKAQKAPEFGSTDFTKTFRETKIEQTVDNDLQKTFIKLKGQWQTGSTNKEEAKLMYTTMKS